MNVQVNMTHVRKGKLAKSSGFNLPLGVLRSRAGYYIGTADSNRGPVSRESQEYFTDMKAARQALTTGAWTQRPYS
ncbi:MAG: hypothetical protein GY928_35360 [Colwellia sp.]|nr:hypothetical protein [Colwellia sp.]